jgi:hypothetical protein
MYFDQASVTYTDVDEMHVVLGWDLPNDRRGKCWQ